MNQDNKWKPIDTAPIAIKHPAVFSPWLIVGHVDQQWVRIGHFYRACNRWYYNGNYGHGDIPTHWWSLLPYINTSIVEEKTWQYLKPGP